MRASPIDNGGQGCSKTVMANQSHDRGEPPFSSNASLRHPETVGEPYSPNWRSNAPLYEGMAVGPFHIWQHGDGWAVFNNSRMIVGAAEKREAIGLMMRLHSQWVPPPPEKRVRKAKQVEPVEPKPLCYFISMVDGPIKIGASVKPTERMRDLQAACPHPIGLLALAAGGFATEAAYHKRFAAHRLHGEWFDRHPDILAEIDRLNVIGIPS